MGDVMGHRLPNTRRSEKRIVWRVWKRFICLLCVCVLATAVGTGCREDRSASGEGGQSGAADKPRIALVMKSLANEFFATMEQGARQHQQEHADEYDLLVNGIKDERDLSRQVALVEEMIAQQVDAIVIAPADSKALVPVLKRAQAAGIVVVNIDNKLDDQVLADSGVQVPFVGPDNRAGARMVGQFLARHLSAGDEVAILEGIQTSFNGQQRRLGFEDAMKEAGIKVVASQSAQWELSQAHTITMAMLAEHPNLKAILASNDSMALGAMAAAKSAGRLEGLQVVGFDNISAVWQAIRGGMILATADQHADQLAVFGIQHALRLVQDPKLKVEDRQTPVDLITAEDLH